MEEDLELSVEVDLSLGSVDVELCLEAPALLAWDAGVMKFRLVNFSIYPGT